MACQQRAHLMLLQYVEQVGPMYVLYPIFLQRETLQLPELRTWNSDMQLRCSMGHRGGSRKYTTMPTVP